MDIFSLVSEDFDHDDMDEPNCQDENNDNDSLFATPPCTPRRRPVTSCYNTPQSRSPPKSYWNIDDRFAARGKSSSSTSCDDPSNDVPNTPPSLTSSPLQERLQRAKYKRLHMQTSRIASLTSLIHHKSTMAEQLHNDSIQQRILQSQTNNSNALAAKERRTHAELQSRLNVEICAYYKSKCAIKRKEEQLLCIVHKACTVDMIEAAKLRREELDAQHTESLLKQQMQKNEAHEKLMQQLGEKQRRATVAERKERADRKRTLIQYERRALLLQSLDANYKALERSRENKEYIQLQAREEILKCKERGRRVRNCRVIQRFVRGKLGWKYRVEEVKLSEHRAVERLQGWMDWRASVSVTRFEHEGKAEALSRLLRIFDEQSTFDEIRMQMMNPETMATVNVVLDCLNPVTDASFGDCGSGRTVDSRAFLSILLIARCPGDVLGEDYSQPSEGVMNRSKTCAGKLFSATTKLLSHLHDLHLRLSRTHQSSTRLSLSHDLKSEVQNSPESLTHPSSTASSSLKSLRFALTSSSTLFDTWKRMDLETLLDGMRVQLEQSWVIYLSSSKILSYLAEATGVGNSSNRQDDQLTPLRLRHEASRAGSRNHIKRIRTSLDKLVGSEEAKAIVTKSKAVALEEITRTNCIVEMREEVDVLLGRGSNDDGTSTSTPREQDDPSKCTDDQADEAEKQDLDISANLPDELVSNVSLVHRVLLTDSKEFDRLSWDGTDAQTPSISVDEFMKQFLPHSARVGSQETMDMVDVSTQIARSMKLAFFNNIAIDMEQGNFGSMRSLLFELHEKMRALLPNRRDLHSYVNDEQIENITSAVDVIRLLIRCGHILSNYLESPARSLSTRDLLLSLEDFNRNDLDETSVPFGLESTMIFTAACVGFVLQKIDLCHADIANYKLACAAPLLHQVGHEYERKQFQKTFGQYENASIESLQKMLPATFDWIKDINAHSESEGAGAQSSLEQKMDLLKSRGFVDGVIFTRNQMSLPEVFTLDAESIAHIRNEARCCVIASALVLHACQVSKAPASILSSDFIPDEVTLAKDALSAVLRQKHTEQKALESSVIGATTNLANAMANGELDATETQGLKNHVLAVLHGDDPVLKLLDNRVRTYFSFACKWKPSGIFNPVEMKTGRSLLEVKTGIKNNGIPSTKEEFQTAARREASRLGFSFFQGDLVDAGDVSRRIVGLACSIYGRDVLDRFLSVQTGD
ncbi:hypothetical protein ACHAXN_011016 [Cyclotella atomus]